MTLVVTSVSRNGITVVGDKAASWPFGDGTAASATATKVFVSEPARISVAIWGSTQWPGGNFSKWVSEFVSSVRADDQLSAVAERFCTEVNSATTGSWDDNRRGAHFAGFVGGVPHLYHAHTGEEDRPQHELQVHRDYPDIHGGGNEAYQAALAAGHIIMLRNGLYRLHTLVGGNRLNELRQDFRSQYGQPLPAPTLKGELGLSAALVRFAASLLFAAGAVGTVSADVDGFAFAATGKVLNLRAEEALQIGAPIVLQQEGPIPVPSSERVV